jgi:hypothetical protein
LLCVPIYFGYITLEYVAGSTEDQSLLKFIFK